MKFFADTANLQEIEYCFSRGVNDGITTNPKIMESTGDLSRGFEVACKSILEKYPNVPVSLETDLGGLDAVQLKKISAEEVRRILLSQANLIGSWGNNVVVKIPICEGGLLATRELSGRGIKTNVTACMTPYQALSAADVGATYVSLFANRMLDSYILEMAGSKLEEILFNPSWKEIVKKNKEKLFEEAWNKVLNDISYVASKLDNSDSELIIGSIRTPEDIYKLVKAAPQIITIPTPIVKDLKDIEIIKKTPRSIPHTYFNPKIGLDHPMTLYTIEEFEQAAKKYRV